MWVMVWLIGIEFCIVVNELVKSLNTVWYKLFFFEENFVFELPTLNRTFRRNFLLKFKLSLFSVYK